MKQILAEKFARALYEASKERKVKTDNDIKLLVDDFWEVLKRQKKLSLTQRIVDCLPKVAAGAEGNNFALIETAREGVDLSKIKKNFDLKDEAQIKVAVKAELVAGVKVVLNGNRLLDASLKGRLDKILK